MSRLIDADVLQGRICGAKCGCEYEDCGNEGDCGYDHFISSAPTVDAVPVVRCRECKHCDSTIFNGNFIGFCEIRKDSYGAKLRVGLSDYCSDGKLKEGAD